MATQCSQSGFSFQELGSREVVGQFDGGTITSDAGALLLREVEQRTGILAAFSRCFRDHRSALLREHALEHLVAQRVFGLCLGYEDLVDHDELRADPLLSSVVGKRDPIGQHRLHERDRGKALAGKSTLNRLELTPADATAKSRYKKIVADTDAVDRFFVDVFVKEHREPPEQIVLDFDATDDPLHGHQEGRFFHGYYGGYCYLPLYVFCGESLLCARLRPSNIDASKGTIDELARIVPQLRQAWPEVKIVVRGDSGFAREEIMKWCEDHAVDYVFGLAKNARLTEAIADELEKAKEQYDETKKPSRVFRDFQYRTLDLWSRQRRVVGKAEHLDKGANPRFVVTSIAATRQDARSLYEETYCARGEMENRIKEQQLYMFADRTSAATMRANQLRLWFSSVAYLLMHALRSVGLRGTELAKAQCVTIRSKLLKLGAQVRVTIRRVCVSFAESFPYRDLFARVLENLRRVSPLRC
ncbi:MAG: IS1380 family transposase [Planctomycetes bacterium]|nr:IS1380 family transposase [Planctomycetota bacterium]MBI3848199.1 IS1380 family transposase [Planctomycetota bacterium]